MRVKQSMLYLGLIVCGLSCSIVSAEEYLSERLKECGDLGRAQAISGGFAVVGAHDEETIWDKAGSAYILQQNSDLTWSKVEQLRGPDSKRHDTFGWSVDISGDLVIVGAMTHDGAGHNAGAAYIYKRDSLGEWNYMQKLMASDAAHFDYFGCSVSISQEYALVGAFGDDDHGENSGAAYLFRLSDTGEWHEVQKLTASDAREYDFFGRSVDIDGDTCVVSAFASEENPDGRSFVSVFEHGAETVWKEMTQRYIVSSVFYNEDMFPANNVDLLAFENATSRDGIGAPYEGELYYDDEELEIDDVFSQEHSDIYLVEEIVDDDEL